jgi:hypothetical protein
LKDFAQNLGLFGVLRHSVHLDLELPVGDRPLPVILERLRLAHVICDFFLKLRLRHHCIERRLGIRAFFRPDTVTPVNAFNCSLMSHAFCERQRWFPLGYALLDSVWLHQREGDRAQG